MAIVLVIAAVRGVSNSHRSLSMSNFLVI